MRKREHAMEKTLEIWKHHEGAFTVCPDCGLSAELVTYTHNPAFHVYEYGYEIIWDDPEEIERAKVCPTQQLQPYVARGLL